MDNKQREEFLRLSLDGKEIKSLDFKNNNYPPYIYKYCSFDNKGENLENIKNDCVYLCPANEFNDPYDARIYHDKKKIIPYLKPGKSYEKLISKIQNMGKVSCFSEKDTEKSLLMWAHYTNKHEGFCLKYNTSEIIPKLDIPNKDLSKVAGLFPVIYREKQLDFTEEAITYRHQSQNKNKKELYLSALVKYIQWEYEQEWRLISINPNSDIGQTFPMPKPSAIYLGTKIEPKNKKLLAKIILEKDINVYQMIFSDTEEYRLHPKLLKKKDLLRLAQE